MKKNFRVIVTFLLIILSFSFVGCLNVLEESGSGVHNKNSNVMYIDDKDIVVDGLAIQVSCYESQGSYLSENSGVTVYLMITNTETKEKNIKVERLQLLQEETGVEYEITVAPATEKILRYGMDETFTFHARIPNSYKKDKYALSFFAEKEYVLYLYERPDELREDCLVQFNVGGRIVQEIQVKKGRALAAKYTWEDPNHLYYCNTWYDESVQGTEFSEKTKIETDLVLYGYRSSVVSATRDSSGVFINKINYVPQDGILLLTGFSTDRLFISNFALKDNEQVREIYIPKNLKTIYFGNFEKMPNLKKIHFEGTKEEWESIPTSSEIAENVLIVYNSKY
ncbi:MAG: hypothetical protein J6K86_06435 [Clostridia bacterium]|nr:hypothetical protein [Clostridia bacterium]